MLRTLVKQPGFTAIVVISLALGIGSNTMVFTMVNGLLLRPLQYPNDDRLVAVWFTPPDRPAGRGPATRRNCVALRERNQTLEHVGCVQEVSNNISGDGPGAAGPERLQGQRLTAGFARALGVKPLLGRWFTDAEEDDAASAVIVLSHRQWQTHFGAVAGIIGTKVRVDSTPVTVIGVMPPDFEFRNPDTDYWTPFTNPPSSSRSPARFLSVVARLKPGVTLERAQADMNALAAALGAEMPETNNGWGIRVQPLHDAMFGDAKEPMFTFQGAVAFVLLIACANVAGLLLAQGIARQKELAVRTALGSSRWRIVRQLLTESVILAMTGGALGLALGWAGLRLFLNALGRLPGSSGIVFDANVVGFTLLISVGTGLIFGVLPALQVSKPDLVEALRESGRSATATRSRQKLRSAFVVVEISLALVLTTGAGLMIRSFLRLQSIDAGFDTRNLMTFQVQFPYGELMRLTGAATPSGSAAMVLSPRLYMLGEEIRQRLSAIPGVQSATAGITPPLSGGSRGYTFTIEGKPAPTSESEALGAAWFPVFPGYFRTLGIPLIRGREFTAQDSAAGLPVVLINQAVAQRIFRREDPIGKRIQVGYYNDPPRQIVGIVGDARQVLREREVSTQLFIPYAQLPLQQEARTGDGLQVITFIVRSRLESAQLVPAMRSAIADVDRTLALSSIQTVEAYASRQLLEQWAYVMLLGAFGGIAVLLAVVGIYGVMMHSVNQRTSEIGVRVALGASSGHVLRVVLWRGLILIGIGITIGFTASLALTRIIQRVLWGVTATDPLTFSLAILTMAAVAALACWIPARRALKIDPLVALRCE